MIVRMTFRLTCLLYFKVLAVTGLVHRDFRVDKVAPKDKYFQSYFCGMFSQEKNVKSVCVRPNLVATKIMHGDTKLNKCVFLVFSCYKFQSSKYLGLNLMPQYKVNGLEISGFLLKHLISGYFI